MAFYIASAFEQREVQRIIKSALEEDIGVGDVTANATVPNHVIGVGKFLAKEDGVIAGLKIAENVLWTVDKELKVVWNVKDGDRVVKGFSFGTVTGKVRSILTAERVSLNLLQRMSGVATLTRVLVDLIPSNSKTKILDTRKTMPGLRILDKMAVRMGGGFNHRYALYDMILIKDNHVDAAGSIPNAVANARKFLESKEGSIFPRNIPIEVETRSLDEVVDALSVPGLTRIMLDNFVKIENGVVDVSRLQEALSLISGKVPTEASGNINEKTLREVAMTNVDYVSVGAITHSAKALDISLKITPIRSKI